MNYKLTQKQYKTFRTLLLYSFEDGSSADYCTLLNMLLDYPNRETYYSEKKRTELNKIRDNYLDWKNRNTLAYSTEHQERAERTMKEQAMFTDIYYENNDDV